MGFLCQPGAVWAEGGIWGQACPTALPSVGGRGRQGCPNTQTMPHPEAGKWDMVGAPQGAQHPWLGHLQPVPSGCELALGVHVGNPQCPCLFPCSQSSCSPSCSAIHGCRAQKPVACWDCARWAGQGELGRESALSQGAGGRRGGAGGEAEGRAGRKPPSAVGGWRGGVAGKGRFRGAEVWHIFHH